MPLKCPLEDLLINYKPIQKIFYNLKIKAENVEVTELERYDL